MHELNKTYRGIDRTTDVLSFAYEDNENIDIGIRMLGEIFVSIPKMKKQAIEYGHSETRELSFLVVHGILPVFDRYVVLRLYKTWISRTHYLVAVDQLLHTMRTPSNHSANGK